MQQLARAIVLRDDQLLVMRRERPNRVYYSLVGGSIELGETPEQAVLRELAEETGLTVLNPRLVILQQGGGFGEQFIFYCDYVGGEPALASDSIEARLNQPGQNFFEPTWLPLTDLPQTNLLPAELKHALIQMLPGKLPERPLEIHLKDASPQ